MKEIKAKLAGPKPLRTIAGLIGLTMMLTSAIGFLNIFALLSNPPLFLLQFYEFFFASMILVVELKDIAGITRFTDFVDTWFPFVNVVVGKGLLMVLAGVLGMGFGFSNLLCLIPGLASVILGVVYILIYFAKFQELNDAYDQTLIARSHVEV